MAYVPHTDQDRQEMLAAIGASSIQDLFQDVPSSLRFPALKLPLTLSEQEIMAEMRELSETNSDLDHHPCFLGAGAYNHFVPSVVKHVAARSEFYTAYTPYQPEVSQGTLQATFEYQSMICDLTGMEVANASHYDGATAMAEALIMAMSVHRGKRNRIVMSRAVNPQYIQTCRTYTTGMELEIVGADTQASLLSLASLVDSNTCGVVVQVPDFFGNIPPLADLVMLAEKAHEAGALFIASVNPISLGLLKPPSEYEVDIVVGEGQALGNALSFGGPYLGFFATKMEYVRRMAGRLVGMTVDSEGKQAFVLTLATREQHIRRERATSNICTNQALNALMAAAYMAAMGPAGMRAVAEQCYHKAHYAASAIRGLPGYEILNDAFFHEFIVRCPKPVEETRAVLLAKGIIPGYNLAQEYPEYEGCMLLCFTEMNTKKQIDQMVEALGEIA